MERQGRVTSMEDQNGTTHTYEYDDMGRPTGDEASLKAGSAVDDTVLKITRDITGEIIDAKGYPGAVFILATDGIAASNLDAQLLIQEGDGSDRGDAAAVSDEFLIGTEAATSIAQTDDKVAKRVGVRVTKRYCRANLTVTANDGTDVVACTVLLGGNNCLPGS